MSNFLNTFDSRQSIIVPTYLPLLDRVIVDKEAALESEAIALKIAVNLKHYQSVEDRTGVPARFIGTLHHLESDGMFDRHLANGDPISMPTVNEPVGIPAGSWEDCAVAALALKGWTIAAKLNWDRKLLWLWRAEKWNGWGYRMYHPETPSPYLWSGTSESRSGKYVSDGKWDANAISKQIGCVAIWLALGIKLDEKTAVELPSPSVPVQLPSSEQPLILEPIVTTDRVIGVLKISTKTWIKSSPQMAKDLAPADKYQAYPDQMIPIYQRLPDKLGHYNVIAKSAGVLRSLFCYTLHAGIELYDDLNPDEIGSAVPAPGVELSPVYQVRFRMQLKKSSDLLSGILEFILNGKTYNEIICTSSLAGNQYDGSWNKKGGLIPPTSLIQARTGRGYKIKTTPIYLPNVLGISGNFYPIEPFEVETDGDVRGDWGVHMDKNTPGSLGCIIAETDRGWIATQREFKVLEKLGIRAIDLIVEYS